jgi:hypothetical protein
VASFALQFPGRLRPIVSTAFTATRGSSTVRLSVQGDQWETPWLSIGE